MVLPSQAYEVTLAPHPAPFSVLHFEGDEGVSRLYRYDIQFTCARADIPMDQVLGRPAKFVIDPIDPNAGYLLKMFGEHAAQFSEMPAARTVHGIVTQFDQFDTSADETRYRIVIEPRVADLARAVTSRLFQKQSVQEIITDTLRHYGYREGVDFKFNLRAEYQRHEYITQYQETTFSFIQRVAADEGIWFRFEQQKNHEVIVFGDDLDAYARRERIVPFRRHSGLANSGAESIRSIERRMRRVPEAIRLNDYNHRQAGVPLLVEQNAARDDATTNAIDYRWGEHYETPEEGRRIATLRHEAHLAQQITFEGKGNVFALEAGEVLNLDQPLPDAPHGLFILSVSSSGGRKETYSNTFTAIPSNRVWRTPVIQAARPVINGILPARITSPGDYKRAYLTEEGWYVIKLPFDLDAWSPGGTSRPVRLAKPYSGDDYGHHFPLIDGAEVAIIHTDGDPDRPVIIGAMHDSLHPDLVNNLNHTRNLIRTVAQNELRMEDLESREHIHLTTPFQISELNLGHMVDGGNAERGRGAELRTDAHVAVRGGRGVLLSAEAQASATDAQLEMKGAQSQLEEALVQMQLLARAAQSAQALANDIQKQQSLLEERLLGLNKSVLLAAAPDGMALTSGQHLQMTASDNLMATAGGSVDIGAIKDVRLAAAGAVSLFAQASGMKLIAAKEDLIAQAQEGQLMLNCAKDARLTSNEGQITVASKEALTLTSRGAYIKIANGDIELGCPGNITLKCGSFHWEGPAGLPNSAYPWPGQIPTAFSARVVLDKQMGEWIGGTNGAVPYQFIDSTGRVVAKGSLDEHGRTQRVFHNDNEALTVLLGEPGTWCVTEHHGDDCVCGADHSGSSAPGFVDLASSHSDQPEDGDRPPKDDDNQTPLQWTINRPRESNEKSPDAFRRLLLERIVYSDPGIAQAIADGEE
ncbi:type VI secretion system Vgr family protein [Paraburkholderia sp. DHOC27]|uniref:type VI secretion system Vgr family protein n=1 Tax=Paraburkholderia sp. DHOC27 TaxID=2303330 RepID=UPI000E3C7D59|nr:type VI secretion system Vgr family protein [Paraburkholderia sp. DHOC27]RFU45209.1 type VI secretion system tip protein VgrG [Paraburkholderia sp. DHOC27]